MDTARWPARGVGRGCADERPLSVDGRPDAVSRDEVAHQSDAPALEVMTPVGGSLSSDELPDGLIVLDADGTVRVYE